MDYDEYQRRVLARASTSFHNEKLDIADLRDVLNEFIEAGNRLDQVKKSLMYGRDFDEVPVSNPCAAVLDETDQQIIHAILGFATEGVELVEALKAFFHGQPFDGVNISEEFGDGEWYRALGLDAIQTTHEENLTQNDAKLEKRYGPIEAGFSYKAANERDLAGERAVLEGGSHEG